MEVAGCKVEVVDACSSARTRWEGVPETDAIGGTSCCRRKRRRHGSDEQWSSVGVGLPFGVERGMWEMLSLLLL